MYQVVKNSRYNGLIMALVNALLMQDVSESFLDVLDNSLCVGPSRTVTQPKPAAGKTNIGLSLARSKSRGT